MREELKKGLSNYLKKFNKYSREEYIDLECKRVVSSVFYVLLGLLMFLI